MNIIDWQKTISKFHSALMDAQKLRIEKSKWIGEEIEWMIYERNVMLDMTNQERKLHDLEPVEIKDILKVENCAAGHYDYTRKFSLYCAEIGIGSFKGYE